MEKANDHVTCVNQILKEEEETLLDHILTSHYHELHLEQGSLLDSSNLIVMLSDLHLDILSTFKGIFHH